MHLSPRLSTQGGGGVKHCFHICTRVKTSFAEPSYSIGSWCCWCDQPKVWVLPAKGHGPFSPTTDWVDKDNDGSCGVRS